jgi:hypothetical protein
VGAFRRSGRFGLMGVLVVMAGSAAIAITIGSDPDRQKLALGLIFALIAAYLVVLFTLQRGDVAAASGAGERASVQGPREIENPTTMDDAELWAAMAVKPIDAEAARARSAGFGAASRSVNLAILVCVLIFAGVVPIYLFDTWIPFVICAPLIGLLAIFGSIRALMPGGEVDKGYANADLAMRPLGLKMSERPDVRLRPRAPTMPGYSAQMVGPMIMEGSRHGRRVRVVTEDGSSQVTVQARAPEFETRARDGRLRLKDGPAAVRDALESVPASQRWGGVKLSGGPEGLVVERKRDGGGDWLCDLWLAERVAQAL